jgi:hypothetical protein
MIEIAATLVSRLLLLVYTISLNSSYKVTALFKATSSFKEAVRLF